jgi:hypothetical protein
MFTQMEMHVLNTLEWTIGHPTIDFFSHLTVTEERDDADVEHMALYLSELALYHRDFVSSRPSNMARVTLAAARGILGRPEVQDVQWSEVDNDLLENLTHHLHEPTVTLSRKYSTPAVSRCAQKLEEFIAQRAAMARMAANCPPSPLGHEATAQGNVFSTPQKGNGHGAAMGFDGYLTPPITPDGVSFANMPKDSYPLPPRCPVTPTPQQPNNSLYARHVQEQYATYMAQQNHNGVHLQ